MRDLSKMNPTGIFTTLLEDIGIEYNSNDITTYDIKDWLDNWEYNYRNGYPSKCPKNYIISLVSRYGGEDMGSEYYNVYSITPVWEGDHVYIKIEGYYSSYDGVDYDTVENSIYRVYPKEKTITVYEK